MQSEEQMDAAKARFWQKVERSESCWIWKGASSAQGHGNCCWINKKVLSAHRVSWQIHYGDIPKGGIVVQSCQNKLCVNPDHLSLGTRKGRQQYSRASLEQRFWACVKKGSPEECWNWTGYKTSFGHGKIRPTGKSLTGAHRVSWMLHYGPIPDGLCVCHKCDNPTCVNPEHLFLGTHSDNAHDMHRKGRGATGDKQAMRKHPELRLRLLGENNHLAKLNAEAVKEIRALRGQGLSLSKIASRFDVNLTTIHNIVQGRTWNHVK